MLKPWKWLLPSACSLAMVGCVSGPTQGHSGASDAAPVSSETDASAGETANDEGGEDTGEAVAQEEDELEAPVRFQGEMDVTYTYSGSFGEFGDVCDGSACVHRRWKR